MEEESTKILKISDLIQRAQPLTGVFSLSPSRLVSYTKPRRPSCQIQHPKPSESTSRNPSLKILKPLNHCTLIVGTLTLPSYISNISTINCNCFQFSDDSAAICCDILNFDPTTIGKKIRIFAWNFIPLKCGKGSGKAGCLEIVSWDFLESSSGKYSSLSSFNSFSANTCHPIHFKDNSNAKYVVFGVVDSISPVSIVPCTTTKSGSSNISGFLVNVLICECRVCSSKILASGLGDLSEKNRKDHCFIKPVIVYFCGSASSWHPVISRLTGGVALFSGLKKKLIFVGKDQSQLTYVTTDEASLHIPKLFKKWSSIKNTDIRGKGECGSYSGIVTGVYMHGMVVELDQEVMLLLTDQQLTVPHSLRVGSIVSLKNVHFVNPKFPWAKMFILGACFRTSICVESFSPLETGCHLKSHSQSRLQKFIDSLTFSARLWVLLVISCFRKKFAGILSEKDIIGSKHNEGLAQKYSNSYLPLSAFQFRRGVFVEFCKHDCCSCGKEAHYSSLKLVPPISSLISSCEARWKKMLYDWKNSSDCMANINRKNTISCGGCIYAQSMRKLLRTEEIGVIVLGTLKISSSGRFQLVDATGSIDVVCDPPSTWNSIRIFEVKDFIIIMEGIPERLLNLDILSDESLSCQSIFGDAPLVRKMETSLYLYCRRGEGSRNHPRSLFFDWKENFDELEGGRFHLLMITHKFPIQCKFQGDQVISKRSNMFSEAIILPWDLLLAEKGRDTLVSNIFMDHPIDSLGNLTRCEKHFASKRCKIDLASSQSLDVGLDDAGNGLHGLLNGSYSSHNISVEDKCCFKNPLEYTCFVTSESVNYHCAGVLRCSKADAEIVSGCEPHMRKVLLEFNSDSFCTYQAMEIGGLYIVKHQDEDIFCNVIKDHEVSGAKVIINSVTRLWSLMFSSMKSLQSSDFPYLFSFHNSLARSEVICKGYQQFQIPSMTSNGANYEIYSDVNIFVPADALSLLENDIKLLEGGLVGPSISFEQESDIHDCARAMITASVQSSGTSHSRYLLPEGNLISLNGLVVAVHDCDHHSFSGQIRHDSYSTGRLPMFLQGRDSACIHVLVDHHRVRIFGNLSKHAYPIGLGRDVYATFHRILVLSGQNEYMLTPVSFITILHTSLIHRLFSDEHDYISGTMGLHTVASPNAVVPTALISELFQFSDLKPVQFHSRVVAVYILVLERSRKTLFLQPSLQSRSSILDIPLAGFVLDDGSSSCCCWADCETAVALLGLHCEEYSRESYAETFGRSKATMGLARSSSIGRLNKILTRHGQVVVKNYGSMFDSSCQDLTFSVDSEKLISSSDEDLLRSLIIGACFSTVWTVVGGLMDPNASKGLEERLIELGMTMLPLQNVWVTSVRHMDPLTEAKNIIQELV
ncbi:conserved telomere maintenance component 1 [Abeliophyllum distichum]|uniref:CST complex subunit CTC1 n=1 Tax=Abeliophyllum distichum TaxID=126358 RepID=A0ABD1NX17_9LAMI